MPVPKKVPFQPGIASGFLRNSRIVLLVNPAPLTLDRVHAPIVVLPMLALNKVIRGGLQFALNLSSEVNVVHVECTVNKEELLKRWNEVVVEPLKRSGLPVPRLSFLDSPYRFVINPIVEYVLNLEKQNPDRQIAVIIPELVEKHWYQYFLHNQRASWLKAALLRRGTQRIAIVDVPWHLNS